MTPSLARITALVRSGAVDRAWALFEASPLAARNDDPAAHAARGRLLKAKARLCDGSERRALAARAAEAYGTANRLSPAPYLAVNAATLHLLAGELQAAHDGARATLAMLDAPEPPADTPYFLAATRAEALLLLGDTAGAENSMEAAVAHDPDGWDDRAATIAQLREISAEQAGDAAWLDRFAPPASLHFAGHMGIAAGGSGEAGLTAALDDLLPGLRIGFAWGALAAGADIVIAEQLLARGVELHAVLPCPAALFEAQSVAPAGESWTARFRAALAAATSVRIAAASSSSSHDPLATAFAGELAIGGAVLNARRFGSPACQLIVADEQGGGRNTQRQSELWRAELGEQHRLTVPRDARVEALFPAEHQDPARILGLHVAIGIDRLTGAAMPSAEIAALAAPVSETLAAHLPAGTVRASAGLWEFATADLDRGLAAIAAVLGSAGGSAAAIGAHLAIGPLLSDVASGTAVAYGPAPGTARALMLRAQPGTALAADDLAVSLAARPQELLRSEPYLPDDSEFGGTIHALIPRGQ